MPSTGRRFCSEDLDEVRADVRRHDGEHSLVVHGRGRLGYERHVLPGRLTALHWVGLGLAQTLRAAPGETTAFVHLPAVGMHRYRFGRRRHAVAPGGAVFVAPGMEVTRSAEPGSVFVIGVGVAALELELRSRRPEADPGATAWALRSGVDALDPVRTRQLAAAVQPLYASLQDVASERADHDEAHMVSLFASFLLEGRSAVAMPGVAARRLSALEGWIDAHLHQPITVGRLCREAGVGARALQLGFQARRGLSPMCFVQERRLSEAHRQLRDARLRDDVTGIPLGLGFGHTGRFAALYRQAFGELPSETFRQARRG